MTPTEVAGLLAYFSAAFVHHEMPDNTPKVWAVELADINAEDAREAMHLLVKSEEFHPSISKFRDTCHAVARRRHMQNADTRGIGEGEVALPMSESAARARAARLALHPTSQETA